MVATPLQSLKISRVWIAAAGLSLMILGGCAEVLEERVVVSNYNDKVSEAEFRRFMEIVKRLPDAKLPELPIFFGPAPDWATTRTLPVQDLVKEENMQLAFRWDVNLLAKLLSRDRALQRSLRRSNMELEEFCVIVEAIGISFCRTTLRPDQNLDLILTKSKVPMDLLQRDERPFSELSRDDVYDVLRRAVWITRVDRATRLSAVPPENLALARKHQEAIAAIYPPELKQNPFDPLIDVLDEKGVPFEELSDVGSDADIQWTEYGVQRGVATPDTEYRPNSAIDRTSALLSKTPK